MIPPDEKPRNSLDGDDVVLEVRRIREKLAARFDHDLHRMFEHARQRTEAAVREGRAVVASPRARRERADP